MGAKIMGSIFDYVLTPPQQIVLLAYADHSDHFGKNIFPSKRLIAWKTGYGVRQVQRITDQLLETGILKVDETPLGKPTKYSIDLSKGVKKPEYKEPKKKGEKVRQDVIRQDVTPDIAMSPDLRHSYVTPTHDMPEPKVYDEPSVKSSNEPLPAPTSGAIIDAWLKVQDAVKPKAFKIQGNHDLARALIEKGINCEDVKAYIRWRRTDPFWDKFLSLEHVAENILSWKKQTIGSVPAQPAAPVEPPAQQDETEFVTIPDGYFEGILK